MIPNYKFKNWEEEITYLRKINKELLEDSRAAVELLKTIPLSPQDRKIGEILGYTIAKAEGK